VRKHNLDFESGGDEPVAFLRLIHDHRWFGLRDDG
jgi:hypothetical protein